jgi:hypothetical protein
MGKKTVNFNESAKLLSKITGELAKQMNGGRVLTPLLAHKTVLGFGPLTHMRLCSSFWGCRCSRSSCFALSMV